MALLPMAVLSLENPENNAPLLWPREPYSCVFYDEMITGPLADWSNAVSHHEDRLSDWAVTKLEHRKNFHFSAVQHEFLKCTVNQISSPSQEPKHIFIERMADKDEVTVGWKWIQHPRLAKWWIQRLMRGYFSDTTRGGVSVLASSSALARWKAIGYSGSDFLCHLDFTQQMLPLSKLRRVLVDSSNSVPKYSVTDSNCFWFAFTVYETLKKEYPCSELRGGYYKHRGKFAGLSILPFNLFSTHTATKDIERAKKDIKRAKKEARRNF